MIIYNVTVNIDDSIHARWLEWMKSIHIPEVMSTGCFIEYRFAKVLVEEESGVTYSIQYLTKSMKSLDDYQINFSDRLQKKHSEKFANQFVTFRTLLELVD